MKAELGTYPKDRQILYQILPIDTPLMVDIHLTHFCNFHCHYCDLSQSSEDLSRSIIKSGMMDWEVFTLIVEQLKEFPDKIKTITLSSMGESTTYPRIVDVVQYLHDADITGKIQIITNASRLTHEFSRRLVEAGLDELRVSIQGLSSEKYMEVSRAKIDWDQFYENLCYFSSIREHCTLKVKIVDTALEEGDEQKFYELFGDICDAVAIEHVSDVWKIRGANLDYRMRQSEKTIYGHPLIDNKICRIPFTSFSIFPDGQVTTACCYTSFGHEKNVRECSLLEQWNSPEWNRLRYAMLDGKDSIEQCRGCTIVNQTYHPEDLLMGHEDEVRSRLDEKLRKNGAVRK